MSDTDELSSTSEEDEALTPAQKSQRTRAKNLAKEQAEAELLRAALPKKRAAKATLKALEAATGVRKRAGSESKAANEPPPPKKPRKQAKSQNADDMDVDEESAPHRHAEKLPAKAVSNPKTKPRLPGWAKVASRQGDTATVTARGKSDSRKYLPTFNGDDNEDPAMEPLETTKKAAKAAGKGGATSKIKAAVRARLSPTTPEDDIIAPIRPRRIARPQKAVFSDDEENPASEVPSDDPDNTHEDSQRSQSPVDHEDIDLDLERPIVVHQDIGLQESHDSELDIPKPDKRRRQSTSSRASSPPQTDFDLDLDMDITSGGEGLGQEGDEDRDEDRDEEGDEEELSQACFTSAPLDTDVPKRKRTAQQSKYEQERPEIRSSKVVHAQPKAKTQGAKDSDPETSYHPSARIVLSREGTVKLADQDPVLKRVIQKSMKLVIFEVAYKDAYPVISSRPKYISKIIRRVAKKEGPSAIYIERRAKSDISVFCNRFAKLILNRASHLRNAIRNCAISKTATHYELNKPGLKSSQIRAIVKQLNDSQHFIFPYIPTNATSTTTVTAAPPAVAPDDATSASQPTLSGNDLPNNDDLSKPPKNLKAFATDQPFMAPAILDIVHEVWWNTRKSLGYLHIDQLKSHRNDRPKELVLPDAMLCLVGAHVWAALQAWSTGRHVPEPEFSQARLEGMYKALLDFIDTQRNGNRSKAFNAAMHKVYRHVSGSEEGADIASGSANNVVSLPIDSD